jgi:methyl-accepting chemotaxis protein
MAKSLRQTILSFILALIIGLGGLSFALSYFQQSLYLKQLYQDHGIALARNLAFNCRTLLSQDSHAPLDNLMDNTMLNTMARGVAFQNAQGKVISQNNLDDSLFGLIEAEKPLEAVAAVEISPCVVKQEPMFRIRAIITLEREGYAQLKKSTILGAVQLLITQKGLLEIERNIVLQYLGLMLLVGLVSVLLTLRFTNGFLKPIQWLLGFMRSLENQQGDLTKRISLQRQDELGQLAGAFNNFVAHLREIIAQAQSMVEQLRESMNTIAANTEEINASAEEMSSNIQSFTLDVKNEEKLLEENTQTITSAAETLAAMARQSQADMQMHKQTQVELSHGQESIKGSMDQIGGISGTILEIQKKLPIL